MVDPSSKTIRAELSWEDYKLFWSIKVGLSSEQGEKVTNERAFEYLLELHREYGEDFEPIERGVAGV